jgi:predicted transcriptional regulator
MSNKEMIIQAVGKLPEDVTLEKIQEEIDILIAIRRGEEDVRQGRVVPHEDVVKELESWITP